MQLLESLQGQAGYDVVVIGAGGAGLAAALFAALDGAAVLLIESTGYVGGTTALSAGTAWIPATHHAASVSPQDTAAAAATYLAHALGQSTPTDMCQSFLDRGATAVRRLESDTEVRFRPYPHHPDYISDLPGATSCGRALEPLPFDGRKLGPLLKLIRPPIPEFTVLGGMMVDRTDINHLLACARSWASFKHSAKIIARHVRDRLTHPRGTRLVMGNAHVARLLCSLSSQTRVSLALNTQVTTITRDGRGVNALQWAQGSSHGTLSVRQGVILAGGGFNRSDSLRASMLPGAAKDWCPGAPGHTGQAQGLAIGLGARYGNSGRSNAFWAPVSLRHRADGSQAVFPHFVMDRAKPGMLTVNRQGQRFVNESTSYHLFAHAMLAQNPSVPSIPAYLICDRTALLKYGLGMVRPGGMGLKAFIRDGYLTQAGTLGELARELKIDPAGLSDSVARMNRYAQTGVDPDFHRGETTYQKNLGDAGWSGPNPCLGPLGPGPYYAVKLYPGDIGASTGLVTDTSANVLDKQDRPIAGLYAVGNEMDSIMQGVYAAPGITIGPGLVFAYLAARHCTNRR